MEPSKNEWATVSPPANCYLVNFHGRWGSTSWNRQEENIAGLGPEFERAHEAIVASAAHATFAATGERLLPDWSHWGPSRYSDGYRAIVGSFDRRGLEVYSRRPYWGDDGLLRGCLLRQLRH